MVDKIDTCASETQISTAEFDRIRFLDGDLRRLRAERDAMIDDARWWGTIRNCGMPTLPLYQVPERLAPGVFKAAAI